MKKIKHDKTNLRKTEPNETNFIDKEATVETDVAIKYRKQ